jgi:hypothetical protein
MMALAIRKLYVLSIQRPFDSGTRKYIELGVAAILRKEVTFARRQTGKALRKDAEEYSGG